MDKFLRSSALTLVAIVLSLVTILSLPIDVKSATSSNTKSYADNIMTRSVVRKSGDLEIRGNMPICDDMPSDTLKAKLNDIFQNQYDAFVGKASESARALSFATKVLVSSKYLSVLFYCTETGASSIDRVSTTVVDTENGAIVDINDVFGPNGLKLANKFIQGKVKANPSIYILNFDGIDNSHDFYVWDEFIVFPFDSYEIAPGSAGIQEIGMSFDGVKTITVSAGDYYTLPPEKYSVKMIRLRQVCEAFGYDLVWKAETKSIDIHKGEDFLASMTVGSNNSYVSGKSPARELERAPEIYADNRTYTPISFYEEILDISYTANSQTGDLSFSVYNDRGYTPATHSPVILPSATPKSTETPSPEASPEPSPEPSPEATVLPKMMFNRAVIH